MKIGIDARGLLRVDDPSEPQYIYRLISGLQKVDVVNDYVLFVNCLRTKYKNILHKYDFSENFKKKILRFPLRIGTSLFDNFHLPIELVIGKVDIFHGPYFSLLNNVSGQSVVTIHDLIFIRNPESVSPWWREFARKRTSYSINKADAVIAVSEFTKSEIIDLYGISEQRIKVIYNGIGNEFNPRTERLEEVKCNYGIGGKYLLFVGAIEPRKNLLTLIRAFAKLLDFIGQDYQLVVVGVKRFKSEEIFKKVRELHLEKYVIFTGKMPICDLPVLYSGAEVFVFPSLSEGFGIPPLEAMACGTPVIASNLTSIPEVVGEAALLVDPRQPNEIAQAIEAVVSDRNLKKKMREKGFERASFFSWERTAKETLRLYRDLA